MASKPTIYKATLNLVDMNREIYATEKLTLALHPSETQTRMMVRLLSYALNYHPDLEFSKGLSATDEPDLWLKRGDGSVENWIEVGQASPERLRKAVSKSDQVRLYAYGDEVDIWWNKHEDAFSALPKCEIFRFHAAEVEALPRVCQRNMELTVSISEDQLYVVAEDEQLEVSLYRL